MENLLDHYVYRNDVIEFVTVVAQTCLFLENAASNDKIVFVDKSLKLFPLLYLKTALLTPPEQTQDSFVQRFVSEEDYNFVQEQVSGILAEDDAYLEVFQEEMRYSDTPITAFVSENLADIYQEIKDMAGNYQTGEPDVMNDAIGACMEAFREHWGQKLLNAMRALHAIKYQK